jgi:hypothetical protein
LTILCIKLEIIKELHYDARPNKSQGHSMQICQELLNQYESEGDSFLDRIITGDETWCHHYEPESKWHLPWCRFLRV